MYYVVEVKCSTNTIFYRTYKYVNTYNKYVYKYIVACWY